MLRFFQMILINAHYLHLVRVPRGDFSYVLCRAFYLEICHVVVVFSSMF